MITVASDTHLKLTFRNFGVPVVISKENESHFGFQEGMIYFSLIF